MSWRAGCYSRLGLEKALTTEFDVSILRPRLPRPCFAQRSAAPRPASHESGDIALTEKRPMPEFSRPVQIDACPADGASMVLRAGQEECAALARRLGLLGLSGLLAKVGIRRTVAGLVRLNVDFSANVVQSCVASLEAVPGVVSDRFSVLCESGEQRSGRHKKKGADEAEVFVDPFGDDPVEPLEDGKIDLGELVAQHLSLSLDPYPRAFGDEGEMDVTSAGGEDAQFDGSSDGSGDGSGDGSTDGGFGSSIDGAKTNVGGGGDEAVERKNPFAALREWRAEETA
jgi:hypothetical protein